MSPTRPVGIPRASERLEARRKQWDLEEERLREQRKARQREMDRMISEVRKHHVAHPCGSGYHFPAFARPLVGHFAPVQHRWTGCAWLPNRSERLGDERSKRRLSGW